MRSFMGVVSGFVLLGFVQAGGPLDQRDPAELEAKLRRVREQLEKLRAGEQRLAEQAAEAKASAPGSIKAEVSGVLRYQAKDECYYISLWHPNGETRVWLASSNDKVVEKLGSLHGKVVAANGKMAQRHESKAIPYASPLDRVPLGHFYLWSFDIAAVSDTGPKK
jgi:hypothetical protein